MQPVAKTSEPRLSPLSTSGDLYYRTNGSVFGPMQVDPTSGTVRTLTTDGRSLAHPLTAAGLDLAVRDAVQHAPVGEAYSGAIDFLLRKPALARHGRGSLVR